MLPFRFESFCPCQNESTSFDVLFILQKAEGVEGDR